MFYEDIKAEMEQTAGQLSMDTRIVSKGRKIVIPERLNLSHEP